MESLADYTEDRTEALRFYREALAMTEPDEPRHTILFSMAERLIDLGEREQAEACLRDHRAEAEDHNDSDYEQRLKGSCVILPTNQTVQRREPADSLRVKCKRHRRLAPVADLSVGRTD